MSRLIKALGAIFKIIKNPWLLNVLMGDNSVWRERLLKKSGLDSLPIVNISKLIPGLDCDLSPVSFLDGGSQPTDLALLVSLARQIPNCRYFEIGTWRGESVANVAKYATECYTLNLSPDEMRGLGLSESFIGQQGYFSRQLPNVNHLQQNSLTFDFRSLGKQFDLIFIDGDHHYEAVKNDTIKVFENLVHENSIVVWNDYAFNPESVRHQVLAGIMDGTPKELHRYLYHVSNTISAIYINKDFPVSKLNFPSTPVINFEVSLKARNL